MTLYINNTIPSEVVLSISTGSLAESGGVATVTATLSGGVTLLDVVLGLGFGGDAGTGDYTLSTGTITIPAGDTTGTIDLTATQDIIDELDEIIEVSVISIAGGNAITGDMNLATGSIIDDEIISAELSVTTTGIVESG